mmetsp:Transcript_14986/g.24238  ORF Transcript_14986/g.24238 Transcript_14986/m.24238 type:complete len:168 (-) Transcript_14986:1592-2095(-)|eukprot:CAMPEP_0178734496 /NCGR_PEP_ID=MMETSP0744-20121128/1375_1 /TAXON_ID=913974 /ORGANISM="Nitzschia punctata, Strain CCMP561" /LENGTH=167 /DNA_ID=CAMNT_0020386781 /DNA_START=94 /DNA_END=597 /DNA_ORIENTATION=-
MTGTSSPRVLTCAYNRRRNRVHPHHHNIETDGSIMNVQASKPKMAAMKPPRSEQPKLISLGSSSENIQEWPSLIEEKRSDDSKASSDTSELDREDRPSIFRQMADFDDQDDMLVLKRANPVYDSDDEDYFEAPSKRQRTSSSGSTAIQWGARLSEDPTEGFCIRLQH